MVSGLVEGPFRCFEDVRRCAQSLINAGLPPSWTEFVNSQEVVVIEDPELHEPKVGWQQKATKCCHLKFMEDHHWMIDAHGCRKGFAALPAGAVGVSSLHDDAHQQEDQI